MKPLKVNFFTNYEGDRQISMLRYADKLQAAIQQSFASECEIHRYSPPFTGQRAGWWLSRWQKFVGYPNLVRKHRGPLNHIADHGNSHLVNYLPRDRTLITCHDLNLLKLARLPGAPSKRYIYSFWAKVTHMKKAALIITDSHSHKLDVVSLLGIKPEKIRVVYLGVDHSEFRPIEAHEQRETFKRKYNITWPFTIFHLGASAFYKNVEGIIESLAIVREKHGLDAHFVRVGPPLTALQQALVERRKLESYVHTLRGKTDAELRELYLASDVLLFPSWMEGLGLPPLEALCCGTPVIVSNLPPIVEGTGTAALTVPPGDYDAIASAVAHVLQDAPLCRRLRDEGFLQAAKFTWRNTAAGTVDAYRTLWNQIGGPQ